jgi:F-type H+-transporting ATPase subunit a
MEEAIAPQPWFEIGPVSFTGAYTKPEVEIAPPHLFDIGPVPISSGHMAVFFSSIVILVMLFSLRRKISLVPGGLQVIIEGICGWFYDQISAQVPEKYVRMIFTMVMTAFLLILVSNMFIFFPFLGAMRFHGHPMFTTPTAHLSMTIAMALIAVVAGHIVMLIKSPLRHIGAFIRLKPFLKVRSGMDFMMAFINCFIGIIELIGEISKLISLSCRLFGNILAGDIMLAVVLGISMFTNFIAPIPFLGLAILAGVIQAMVFSLLAIQFLTNTVTVSQHSH